LYRYNAEMRIRVRQGAYAVGLVQVETLNPKPYTLYPITYTLYPIPYTLYPKPYTLYPIP
jgi:hypothetical protein